MRYLIVVAALLLQLVATAVAVAASDAPASANIARPGCESKCGKIEIPYPFGTTPGCYHSPGFLVTCYRNTSKKGDEPKLLLGGGDGRQVLHISVQNSTMRISSEVWFVTVRDTSMKSFTVLPSGRPYVLSAAGNRLVHIGCGFAASSWTAQGERPFNTCSSSCPEHTPEKIRHSTCDGMGCCDAPIPAPPAGGGGGLTSFRAQFQWTGKNRTGCPTTSPWITSDASVVAVASQWWRDANNRFMLKMSLLAVGHASGIVIPAILDWAYDNSSTCAEAAKRSDSGCVSKHSECVDSTGSASGYVCRCLRGYEGNPYLSDGCQSPRNRRHFPAWIIFAMGVGIGMCLLLLVLAIIFATKKLKAKKMREHFFKQNRGLLLQQLVDKDIAERMIFGLEELEEATNKFNKARILGGGGHGTVYKGILSDQHVVAIKKSKLVIQREIDGFINEVAILTQINHRNVVKLFGCCLETEVPLLVYEFIPNGTLYAHLHVDSPISIPWKDRLRIAFEVASSLAYLHSEATISIVHRDIKTSNILLDDHLTAKVSDFGASRGIAIDKSGVTTAVQGTYGYLDPEYFYTKRLTEKSDVYSYGVMLVELLTRKKPTADMSLEGISLVAHFMLLQSNGRLSEIVDAQVILEEEEHEVMQVAAIAALCLQMKGDDRPTMRHVEMRLQGLQSSNNNFQKNQGVLQMVNVEENISTRRYSLEREILLSTTLPR
ncbi:unnamed protein product [Urochloa decumbens]|uniref:Protein kinase domain-containing protein n=1 Tax=Urochloa decumbens TaxID=240449 RepID=A0ABC9BJ63_9POAL